MDTGLRTTVASSPEVLAMVTDAAGNLFYSDGNIHRVPAAGGASERIFAFNGSPGGLSLPYFDRSWTLAFDAQGHLLAGGFTLIRISPGADGLVNGSVDETAARIAGIPGANIVGYPEPYSGDGLPALQARLVFTYQMTVAADGAVVFTDENHRIRRIAPGADGVVNGGPDEIVRTIAGFFSATGAAPSGYATSYYGNFRGLVEDPLNPGSFIVSSHGGHQLLRFGIAPTGEEPPPPPGPAVVEVTETITVDDGIDVLPSAIARGHRDDRGRRRRHGPAVGDARGDRDDRGGRRHPGAAVGDARDDRGDRRQRRDCGVGHSAAAPVQLAITPVFRRGAAGQYIAAITVRNPTSTIVTALQLTTAILNSTPAASLPVQAGTLPAGGQATIDVTFPASAGNPGAGNTLRLTFSWTGRSTSVVQRVVLPPPTPPLVGWADLPTHPMSNLAFSDKLFHGARDVDSLMPAVQMSYDPECRLDSRAISIAEALSVVALTGGDPIQSRCGNVPRNLAVKALEEANGWLRWNDRIQARGLL